MWQSIEIATESVILYHSDYEMLISMIAKEYEQIAADVNGGAFVGEWRSAMNGPAFHGRIVFIYE